MRSGGNPFVYAQGADDLSDAVFQPFYRVVVQVIPVFVGDDQEVDVGNVVGRIDVRAFERPEHERHRGTVRQYRIDEEPLAAALDKIGRMPEPYDRFFVPVEPVQVGFYGR